MASTSTSTSEPTGDPHPGILTNNGIQVRMLQQSLSQVEGIHRTIPKILTLLIRDRAWQNFMTIDGHHFRWSPADFRRFLEAPRPSGCQTSVSLVTKILEGTEAHGPFLDLMRAAQPEGTGITASTDAPAAPMFNARAELGAFEEIVYETFDRFPEMYCKDLLILMDSLVSYFTGKLGIHFEKVDLNPEARKGR